MFNKFKKQLSIFLLSIFTIVALASNYTTVSATSKLPTFEKAVVTRHVDGDTVYVKIGNKECKVRFIGINCPESTIRLDPYGKEASNYTKSKLLGKTIYLQKDVSNTDKYGRLLRYVWLQKPTSINEKEIRSKMFNAILVINGYAQAATYPPDVKYSNYFVKFQSEARNKNIGLWGKKYSNSSTTKKVVSTQSKNFNRIVYWTPNGKSYHSTPNCRTLRKSKTIIKGTLKKAIEQGKSDPCDVCN